MAENKLAKGKINNSTQQYLDIAEMKEDVMIMRDGTLRAILLVSSINFALKSEDEQNATVSAYVSFLNNIDFPLQIVIQSRELNIENYIESLKQKEKEQVNELLKLQISDYIYNIQELISMGKIMNKRFYVIIPYNPMSDKQKNFFQSLKETVSPASTIKIKEKTFLRYKEQLQKRVENVMGGLNSVGLNVVRLDTQGMIELFYNSYNPSTSQNQKMTDVKELRVAE